MIPRGLWWAMGIPCLYLVLLNMCLPVCACGCSVDRDDSDVVGDVVCMYGSNSAGFGPFSGEWQAC